MNIFTMTSIELHKIRRSKILLLLMVPLIILWVPNVINAEHSLDPVMEGISPADNFMIQSFMGYAWFILPASIIVCTVMLQQIELGNKGILKILSLPVKPSAVSLSKCSVLILLTAAQCAAMTALYFLCSRIASAYTGHSLTADAGTALTLGAFVFLASLPMLALYWMLAVCIRTPVFSIILGLATMVPSVLILNVKAWFLYPPCYPFYVIIQKYSQLSGDETAVIDLWPWLPAAAVIFIICISISCLNFGRAERR